MRAILLLAFPAFALGYALGASAQGRSTDDSFMPVIVERPDTISITTNSDPDIYPGLRPLPPENFSDTCIDLKERHAEEAKTIAPHASIVARKGNPRKSSELQIRLARERTIRLFDYPCGEDFTSYIFVDLLPKTGIALVQQNIYEDYSYLAISLNTGRVSTMLDRPALSPDGKRFATYRYDQMNAVTELTLYAVRSDRVVAEARCEVIVADNENGAARPKWINAESLSFVLHDTGKPFPDGPTLKRQGKDWVLEGPVTFTLEGRQKKAFRKICETAK